MYTNSTYTRGVITLLDVLPSTPNWGKPHLHFTVRAVVGIPLAEIIITQAEKMAGQRSEQYSRLQDGLPQRPVLARELHFLNHWKLSVSFTWISVSRDSRIERVM